MNKENMDLRRSIQRFPSPTGVKYYELRDITKSVERELFPSPTGVKYYESAIDIDGTPMLCGFPSPTGVKYYEFDEDMKYYGLDNNPCFRPQQGLSIMN